MSNPPSPKCTYHLTPTTYILPLLHAAKNLSSTINGLLLGRIDPTTSKVVLEDAVPLLHNYISLTPMMEIGMELADTYATEKGLRVVGYYQGNEGVGTELGRVGERVLESLKGKFDGAFAMVIDSTKFGPGDILYTIYHPASSSSSPLKPLPSTPSSLPEPFHLPSQKSVPAEALKLIRDDHLYKELGDFDDHLEDVQIDWINNPKVKEVIKNRLP